MNVQYCIRLQKLLTRYNCRKIADPIRTYLTAASPCTEKWNQRLTEKHIKDAQSLEASYKLLENEATSKRVLAVDLDIFANCIRPDGLPAIFENLKTIIAKFRVCDENYKMLSSTSHAILRVLMEVNYIQEILMLLANPKENGIFIDRHFAKLFMDTSIKEERFADAVLCAAQLMLQEEFDISYPITTDLAILSCLKYLFTEGQEPLKRYKIVHEESEDMEEFNVDYIPTNCPDEHFSLTEDRHIIGKTLMYASYYQEDTFIKQNVLILGLSMFEKWSKLEDAMVEAKKNNITLATDISSHIEQQLASCEVEDKVSRLKQLLEDMTSTKSDAQTCLDYLEDHIHKTVEKYDAKEIDDQVKLYDKWNEKRIEVFDKEQIHFRAEELKAKIEAEKTALENEEDYLHFYENEDLWLKRAKIRKELIDEKNAYLKKITLEVKTDDSYVVPEMSDMPGLHKTTMATKKKVKREGRRYQKYHDLKLLVDSKERRHCGFRLYKDWTAL